MVLKAYLDDGIIRDAYIIRSLIILIHVVDVLALGDMLIAFKPNKNPLRSKNYQNCT